MTLSSSSQRRTIIPFRSSISTTATSTSSATATATATATTVPTSKKRLHPTVTTKHRSLLLAVLLTISLLDYTNSFVPAKTTTLPSSPMAILPQKPFFQTNNNNNNKSKNNNGHERRRPRQRRRRTISEYYDNARSSSPSMITSSSALFSTKDDDDDDSAVEIQSKIINNNGMMKPPPPSQQQQSRDTIGGGNEDKDDDGISTTVATNQGVMTPYDILYPEVLLAAVPETASMAASRPPTTTSTSTTTTTQSSKSQNSFRKTYPTTSLHFGIRLMKEALQEIITNNGTKKIGAMYNTNSYDDNNGDDDDATTTTANGNIIRIEIGISHDVEPLCWLQAQTTKHKLLVQQQQQQEDDDSNLYNHPSMYFGTAEETFDSAVFGSSITYRGSSQDDEYWNLIHKLPNLSYLYGGQRFDIESVPSTEWEAFSQGIWILPAVELRRQAIDIGTTNKRQRGRKPENDSSDNIKNNSRDQQQSSTVDSFWSGNDKKTNRLYETTLAVHLQADGGSSTSSDTLSYEESAKHVLKILELINDSTTPKTPPTTLAPVLSRDSSYGPNLDGQEIYERGVTQALEAFRGSKSKEGWGDDESDAEMKGGGKKKYGNLQKVVLARRMDLTFSDVGAHVSALDILRKWKFGVQPGGHLFYINPGGIGGGDGGEFFGCTPERLFQLDKLQVSSEALAGTRPRGSTQQADEELSRELFESEKDQVENEITGTFIRDAFQEMRDSGWLVSKNDPSRTTGSNSTIDQSVIYDIGGIEGHLFVRRLRHLQHICQQFRGQLTNSKFATDVSKFLLSNLHPTPAMGGFPKDQAMQFIRDHETIGFDRGFFSGPVGFVGRSKADIVVAIRSGLVSSPPGLGPKKNPIVSVYAGAGLVPGSTVQGEWAETSYKLAVVSSIFPQSPITLQSATSPNVAWSTAFIEELIRNGVTQFYVCPGSRSTPLVAAIARAVRSSVGIVHALSVHDERVAGFRALGYGRGAGRPAAVITSSGTAIANLYPAIVEAGMDGIPMIVLTADRPYENRDTGANQSIDQVKAYSSSYIRWFRDILPPHDDVSVAVGLSDAANSIRLSRKLRGPVHLNVQFRENLAPESGPIRNDNRAGSVTTYDGLRFTDVPGFNRWSTGGNPWMKSFTSSDGGDGLLASNAVAEIANLITQSSRGLIIVGGLRARSSEVNAEEATLTAQIISDFAQSIGFPIAASIQGGSLRFDSPAVIPYAEHVFRNPVVQSNVKPDLILQLGTPLISTALPKIIATTMKNNPVHHVLVHPHHPHERADPDFTVTHQLDTEIIPFLKALHQHLNLSSKANNISSELAPLVLLGRKLQSHMPALVIEASREFSQEMTEPELVVAMSGILSDEDARETSLFLSNSMPVRDADSFLYPSAQRKFTRVRGLREVGVNRGASGIDGVISSAAGFAESTERPTTLLIGDVAALHDINSLHSLRASMASKETKAQRSHPLSTIVLNNDGGGIFSFLPVSKYGTEVAFEEFFGTPTNTFSFSKASEAFGIPFNKVTSTESFVQAYHATLQSNTPVLIEAVVAPRAVNVAVHSSIEKRVGNLIDSFLNEESSIKEAEKLPIKFYAQDSIGTNSPQNMGKSKTLVLLHGWMGDKAEWDEVGQNLVQLLPSDWTIIAVDLPGHGSSKLHHSSQVHAIKRSLGLHETEDGVVEDVLSMEQLALTVLESLRVHHGVKAIDAVAGYSLGGRVALAMQRICVFNSLPAGGALMNERTKIVLLSAYPGDIRFPDQILSDKLSSNKLRMAKDERLSKKMLALYNRSYLKESHQVDATSVWFGFLSKWYGNSALWGELLKEHPQYGSMLARRVETLSKRGPDLAVVLRECSPPRYRDSDWQSAMPGSTLFISGEMDSKYSSIGKQWKMAVKGIQHFEIPKVGHALLVEAPMEISDALSNFLQSKLVRPFPSFPLPTIGPGVQTPFEVSKKSGATQLSIEKPVEVPEELCCLELSEKIGSLDYEAFAIRLVDEQRNDGVSGIGWGREAETIKINRQRKRSGFIIQALSVDGSRVGLGEVSPLKGVHEESYDDVQKQLENLAKLLQDTDPQQLPSFDAARILRLEGGMNDYLNSLLNVLDIDGVAPSVRSGLEMALVSLASQVIGKPVHQALLGSSEPAKQSKSNLALKVNGLITRKNSSKQANMLNPGIDGNKDYPSMKAKVGHATSEEDAVAIAQAFQMAQRTEGMFRADANRAFTFSDAVKFSSMLASCGPDALDRFEYIEEPLVKHNPVSSSGNWSLAIQVDALEQLYIETGVKYALDESLFDVVHNNGYDFQKTFSDLRDVFPNPRGCAAIILKPSVLGIELSLRLARAARKELGISSVFTSAFDSGVGLSYVSFLGSISDLSQAGPHVKTYPHGVGTFSMLMEDSLSPSFGSYVSERGVLNIASLSRALYGLGLDEIRDAAIAPPDPIVPGNAIRSFTVEDSEGSRDPETNQFDASIITSSSGREISVVASLPLPFSADIACSRFTDLPQQPRWSPWISSVTYLDSRSETEWTLRVRGVDFRWRATSSLLEPPLKGIRWESVNGLKNIGVVEFESTGEASSLMTVRMTVVAPRILSSLFKGTAGFFDDFLRNKLLKWSLEMFRDVVKGDLALEEGDVELGDALFGAVEGKASAIEATLSFPIERRSRG